GKSASLRVVELLHRPRRRDVFRGVCRAAAKAGLPGTAQFLQRSGLDLSNALAREREVRPDFSERVIALLLESEAQLQDPLLARSQPRKEASHLLGAVALAGSIESRECIFVTDEIPDHGISVLSHRGVDAD